MSKRFDVIEKRLDQTVSKDEHNSIVVRLEDIQDKLKGLAEAMAGLITKVNVMDRRLEKVEEDTSLMLPILKVAVKDQTKRLTL
jgi:tetrahydromethanopterin S-methyltransferase subunit G